MMCSSSDLGTECVNPHQTRGMPERILLYDKHPGGIGIVSKVIAEIAHIRLCNTTYVNDLGLNHIIGLSVQSCR
jgi:DEAD/DEAH box helicase domain-containing protein